MCTNLRTILNFRNINFRKSWYGTDRFYFSGKLQTLMPIDIYQCCTDCCTMSNILIYHHRQFNVPIPHILIILMMDTLMLEIFSDDIGLCKKQFRFKNLKKVD